MSERVFAINPGSTSTKIAVFDGEQALLSENIRHSTEDLAAFGSINDQLDYRKEKIVDCLQGNGIDIHSFDAVSSRVGGLYSTEGGVYRIDELLLEHARAAVDGIQHPAQLGPQLAVFFAAESHCPAFCVNPPMTDELQPVARITGIKGIYRKVRLHALSHKETAIKHSEAMGRKYEDSNYIVCHLGGGISISAHRRGRMIDGNDVVGGEGPMTPTRCGSIPAMELIDYCYSGVPESTARRLCDRTGGFLSLLGTADAVEVSDRAKNGQRLPKLAWDAMVYQIEKEIGAMAAVLHGEIDGILLTGGLVHNADLVDRIREACGFLAPITAYPGEFEMEALANGAIRALHGREPVKKYSGRPVWTPAELVDSQEEQEGTK